MIVRVCASTPLPSRTRLPANSPIFDRRLPIVAAGRDSAVRRAKPTEPNMVKPIHISRMRKNPLRRTHSSYLPYFQKLNRKKGPIFEEMYVSGSDRAGEPGEPNRVKRIQISRIPQKSPRRTQRVYLHCVQQFNGEQRPIFRDMYVSGPRPMADSWNWQFSATDRGLVASGRGCSRATACGQDEVTPTNQAGMCPLFNQVPCTIDRGPGVAGMRARFGAANWAKIEKIVVGWKLEYRSESITWSAKVRPGFRCWSAPVSGLRIAGEDARATLGLDNHTKYAKLALFRREC
jgi:hypothetical protein